MVIEKLKHGNAKAIYRRSKERGRMLPEGLRYVDSWIEANLDRCFQLMECDDPRLFQEWVTHWDDLIEFEIIPVVSSKETAEIMNKL